MSIPSLAGRPATPPPGAPAPELLVARLRGTALPLLGPALLVVAVACATGYLAGNLPEPFTDALLFAVAGAVVLLGGILPFIVWVSRTYTITTRRVIARHGLLVRHSVELSHARGYTVHVRRGLGQRLAGTGTLVLSDGVSPQLTLRGVPLVGLVQETLADQIEMNQIQAHRESQGFSFGQRLPAPERPAPDAPA